MSHEYEYTYHKCTCTHTHTYQIHMPMHTHTHMHMQQKLEWYTHQRVPRDILTQWTSHARYTCTHSNNVHSATHSHSTNEIIQILVFTPGVLFYLLSRAGGYYLLHLTDILFLQHRFLRIIFVNTSQGGNFFYITRMLFFPTPHGD